MARKIGLRWLSGPDSGERISLDSGQTLRFGSDPKWCDVVCEWDASLSLAHFAVEAGQEQVSVRDLNSRIGTMVNGVRIRHAVLKDGDRIAAGTVVLGVEIAAAEEDTEEKKGADKKEGEPSPSQRLLELLRRSPEPLFAVLDAARDPRVVELLRTGGQEGYCLLEGQKAAELAEQAPYLVQIRPESPFLEALATEGWGKAWGFYLTSQAPLYDTREHLRQFLLVKDQQGRTVYFRFYDPRIFRAFLPVCDAQETAQIFGPVLRFLVESENGAKILAYTRGAEGPVCQAVELATANQKDSSGASPSPSAESSAKGSP